MVTSQDSRTSYYTDRNASLMTNLTTACGFSTFILTESKLKRIGIIAYKHNWDLFNINYYNTYSI